MVRVGINGFGRIGRLLARKILQSPAEQGQSRTNDGLELVAVNTSGKMGVEDWGHLLKYDTTYGKINLPLATYNLRPEKEKEIGSIEVEGKKIAFLAEQEPSQIPWSDYGVEVVVEATGVFLKEEELKAHLQGSVKKVVLSAPAKSENIPMVILGVNEEKIKNSQIISCGSCTTNCAVPVASLIHKNFGITKAYLNTMHAYTDDQRLQDNSHKDLRRARAAGENIVPTSTGAAKAVTEIIPELLNKFDGISFRVPVVCGSLIDFTFLTKEPASKEAVNQVFKNACQKELKGILGVTEEPVVSSDIIGSSYSALVDLSLTQVIDGNLLKVFAWYDNEWGYVCRLAELVEKAVG